MPASGLRNRMSVNVRAKEIEIVRSCCRLKLACAFFCFLLSFGIGAFLCSKALQVMAHVFMGHVFMSRSTRKHACTHQNIASLPHSFNSSSAPMLSPSASALNPGLSPEAATSAVRSNGPRWRSSSALKSSLGHMRWPSCLLYLVKVLQDVSGDARQSRTPSWANNNAPKTRTRSLASSTIIPAARAVTCPVAHACAAASIQKATCKRAQQKTQSLQPSEFPFHQLPTRTVPHSAA